LASSISRHELSTRLFLACLTGIKLISLPKVVTAD